VLGVAPHDTVLGTSKVLIVADPGTSPVVVGVEFAAVELAAVEFADELDASPHATHTSSSAAPMTRVRSLRPNLMMFPSPPSDGALE
jgi:hypothetical protein